MSLERVQEVCVCVIVEGARGVCVCHWRGCKRCVCVSLERVQEVCVCVIVEGARGVCVCHWSHKYGNRKSDLRAVPILTSNR